MIDHSVAAQDNPIPYQGTITIGNRTLSIIDAANEQNDMPPITKRFGYWAVCNDGSIQCLYTYYIITKERIDEQDWEAHMSEKTWVYLPDFVSALNAAKKMQNLK